MLVAKMDQLLAAKMNGRINRWPSDSDSGRWMDKLLATKMDQWINGLPSDLDTGRWTLA